MITTFQLVFYHLQLVENENVRGVVTMNEDYELRYFSNSKEVQIITIGASVLIVMLPKINDLRSLQETSVGSNIWQWGIEEQKTNKHQNATPSRNFITGFLLTKKVTKSIIDSQLSLFLIEW